MNRFFLMLFNTMLFVPALEPLMVESLKALPEWG